MKKKERKRSAGNAVILKILAEKHNITEQYARICVKGFSESDKAEIIQADYKILEEKLTHLKDFL